MVQAWQDKPEPDKEAAEAKYEKIALTSATDSVSDGENLIIFDCKRNEAVVSDDNETIVSDRQARKLKTEQTPIAKNLPLNCQTKY